MSIAQDPVGLAANLIINVAASNGGKVTGASVAEGLAFCRLQPGSEIYEATLEANYENTRAKIVDLLESSGRVAMIGAKLRESRLTHPPLRAGDRIRLAFAVTSDGDEYPEGATGVIVHSSDPYSAQAMALSASDKHPIKFDRDADGLIAVTSGYLVHE
jgi:hypothetical protein